MMWQKKIDISRHALSQAMNETYSFGYNHYIKKYRIAEAKRLIVTRPDLSLEGIGYEAGFRSKSVFFESFKRHVGCTPASFKMEMKQHN
ncbi:MAG: helix-turn-helix domain-containing protein [Bacteroidota bacterium]